MGDASREIMRQARKQIPEWTPSQVHEAFAHQHEARQDEQEIVLVDVREKLEWNEGHIPGAIHVPRGYLELQVEEAVSEKNKNAAGYLAGGVRKLMAGGPLPPVRCKNSGSMTGGDCTMERDRPSIALTRCTRQG